LWGAPQNTSPDYTQAKRFPPEGPRVQKKVQNRKGSLIKLLRVQRENKSKKKVKVAGLSSVKTFGKSLPRVLAKNNVLEKRNSKKKKRGRPHVRHSTDSR